MAGELEIQQPEMIDEEFSQPDKSVGRGSSRGRPESLTFRVLTYVAEQRYEEANEELEAFLNRKSEFPTFKARVHRYVLHGIDLVNAIDAKRNFPGRYALTTAKQQELNERVSEHYRELQFVLNKIGDVLHFLKADDNRSTIWVVRAFVNCTFFVVAVGLVLEIKNGLLMNAINVMDHRATKIVNWVFDALSL